MAIVGFSVGALGAVTGLLLLGDKEEPKGQDSSRAFLIGAAPLSGGALVVVGERF
jgi:hypothetical protein